MFCQKINITGLNPVQIAAATALLKANLNQQAIDQLCPAFRTFCLIAETIAGAGGDITINVHNFSATLTFDSSSFQLCDSSGVPYANSVQPTVAPLANSIVISVAGPPTVLPFKVRYGGAIVFSDPNPNVGFDRIVTFSVNCGPPPAVC
jgi:hypothetical protein